MLRKLAPCLLLLILTCSPPSSKVTFMIGGAPAELDYWEELAAEFTDSTGIEVSVLRQPTDTDQRRQGLVVPLRAGEKDPDAFLMDIVWIGQFAASGWLEPLDAFIARDKLDLSPFFSRVIDLADRYQGNLIALPVYVDAGLLYYRSDLLDRYGYDHPPETWNELVEMAIRIQTEERKHDPQFWGFVWQGAQYEGLICNFLEFAVSNGGGIIDKEGKLIIDSDSNVEALTFMRDLIARYQISPPNTYTEMKEEQVRTFFESGNALFERNWPYAWGLHQAEDSRVRNRVGIALLPKFEGGEHAATLGGWHIALSRNSDVKEEAWEFVKYVVSKKVQEGFAVNLGWNPSRRDVYDEPEVAEAAPHLVKLREVFDSATARPNLPYYSLLSKTLQQKINAVLSGIESPQEALTQAQHQAEQIESRYSK